MEEAQKAKFLRKAIAELQYSLVYREVDDSIFTKESVARMEQDRKKNAEYYANEIAKEKAGNNDPQKIKMLERLAKPRHEVAHSMLFKTRQPVSVYETDQMYFDWEMENTALTDGAIEEYPFHRLLLAVLNKIKDIEAEKDLNTDILVDFWNKNRNPIFGNAVTEALINQNVNRAAGGLLNLLNKEKANCNHLTAILYRLEFGRIGISEAGVDYLGKMYNLGELNNPDYFAQRLTAKGDVGIFDDRKILQKYFNLGDLTAEEKIIQPQIHDFVYETLFFGKEGESKAERQKREQYLKEFKENYFQFYDDDFFKKTGVRFNNLDFKEQSWFLIYYKNANDQKKDILLDFVKVHGENGLKTFLSLENGEEMGDRILAIGKDIDSISAGLIFNKYAEIVDSVGTIREEVDGLLKSGGKSISSEQIELISQNLISRANRLLVDFSKRKNEGGIVDQLENYRLDLVLSAAFFKVLKQSGAEIKPEDFKGVAFESKATAEISPEELAQMLKIYEDNYSVNHKYSDEHRNKLVNDFKEKIQSRRDDVVVYMCKMDEKIIVFNAFEDSANTNRRGTAFNAIKPVEGSPFAKEFLERSLGKEMASGRTVEVDCDPRSPMSEYYVDRGFIVKGMADKYPGTGELVLNIEISANNQNYDYRKCSREQIIADQGVYTEGAAKTVLKFQIDGPEVLNEFMGKANGMADKGYVITRYVFSDDRKSVYCAFEKSRS